MVTLGAHIYTCRGQILREVIPLLKVIPFEDTSNVCKWAVVSRMGLMGTTVKLRGEMKGQSL